MRDARSLLSGLILAAALLTIATSPATAQPGGGGGGAGRMMMMGGAGGMFSNEAPLSSEDVTKIGKLIKFSPDQTEAAKALLEGYLPEFQKRADEQRKVMDDLREQFRESRDPSVWQDAQPKFRAFAEFRTGWEKKVLDDVQTLLTPEQQNSWPRVDKMRRRESMRRGFIAGERADIVRMVEDLKLADEAMAAVQPILESYESEVDRELIKRNELQTKAMDGAGEAFRGGDMAKMEAMLTENREASVRVRDVNRKYARQVEGVLPEDAKAKFSANFKRESFPQIYRTRYAQQAIDAAMLMKDIEPAQREAIGALLETYARENESLNTRSEKAIEENEATMTAGRMMQGGFGGGGNENEAMRELRTARRTLEDSTVEKLKAVLTPEQAAKLPDRNANDQGGPGGQGGGQRRMGGGNGQPGNGQPGNGGGNRRRNPNANPPAPAPEPKQG